MLGSQRPHNWKMCVVSQIRYTYFRVRCTMFARKVIKKRRGVIRVLEMSKENYVTVSIIRKKLQGVRDY